MRKAWMHIVSLFAVVAIALSPCLAYADDPVPIADDPENSVNVHQLPDSSFIYDATIADLAGADAYYEGQTVQVTGEVVGDFIRGDADSTHGWITLRSTNARSNATLSVYISDGAAAVIDTYGAYEKTGTILQVRGTFHLTCPEHQGITDLHAEYVSVVHEGQSNHTPFAVEPFIPGLITVALGVIAIFVFNFLRERRR